MHTHKVRCLTAIVVMLAFVVGYCLPVSAQESNLETLVGVLSEGDYGLELVVGEQAYVIEDYLPDDLIGQRVKITGSVEEGEDGTLFLSVDAFEPIE